MSDDTKNDFVCPVCNRKFSSKAGKMTHFGQTHTDSEKREILIEELHRLNSKLGRSPKVSDVKQRSEFGYRTYDSVFESWNAALEEAEIEINRRQCITDEELLDELRNIKNKIGTTPTSDDMRKNNRPDVKIYSRRFGSWNKALRKAGLNVNRVANITNNELLEDLKRVADNLSRPPTQIDIDNHGKFSHGTYQSRFGSWNNALQEAGLELNNRRKIPRTELINEVKKLGDDLDSSPTADDMDECGKFSSSIYEYKFGSWAQVLSEAGFEQQCTVYHNEYDHVTRSSWERSVLSIFVDNDIDYEYEGIEIPYDDERIYSPDFVTDNYIIEVKGYPRGGEKKARAALEYLEDREYVLIGGDSALEEIPADHKYHYYDEREQVLELFDIDEDDQVTSTQTLEG